MSSRSPSTTFTTSRMSVFSKFRVISPASGATAAGARVVGLYATSNPDRTGPYLSRGFVADRYEDAVATYLGRSVDDFRWGQRVRDPGAMALISVDDVRQKIETALAATPVS